MPPPEPELDVVDEIAAACEREGLPLITGRVIGWLLVCDPPQQSAAQLAEVLGVSRSSISSATRLLTPGGLVERVRTRDSRVELFRIAPDGWSRMLAQRWGRAADFRRALAQGLDVLADAPAARRERLEHVHELYLFLESELPALWARWEARRAGGDR